MSAADSACAVGVERSQMAWYYAEGGMRLGPLEDEVFRRLVAGGRILATTLVWREGMADWQMFQQVAEADAASARAAVGAICSQCGRYSPAEDMILFRGAWVCAGCKPVFFQRIGEGGTPALYGVVAALRYAGFWIRLAAALIDGIIVAVPQLAVFFLFREAAESASPSGELGADLLSLLVRLAIAVFYETFFVGRYAATLGKMACGLRIVVSIGSPVSYARAFGRYWAKRLSDLIAVAGAAVGAAVGALTGEYELIVLFAIVGALLMLFGYYMAGFDAQKRALHDHVCNTRVIWK